MIIGFLAALTALAMIGFIVFSAAVVLLDDEEDDD